MPLDFEPHITPEQEHRRAVASLARVAEQRTQKASVERVQQAMSILCNVIQGCDWPLGSPFDGLEIEQVVGMLRAGGECWPMQERDLDASNKARMAAIWARIGART